MTFVVGYLPNALGVAALTAAIEETRRRDTDLVAVNTTRADRLVDPRYTKDAEAEALESRLEESRLEESGVPHAVRGFTSTDLAADDVLKIADDVSAELIVIGLRHRTLVGKLVMGSTAQSILLEATCPVLAVKLPRR